MAEKENREDNGLPGGKDDREGCSHFWKGTDTPRESKHLQEGQAITANIQYQEEYFNMEAHEFYSFDKIDIHWETDLKFESVCQQILVWRGSSINFLMTKRKGDIP